MKECALITGAVKNTGPVIARVFCEHGMETVITSRNAGEAVTTAKKISVSTGVNVYGFGFDQGQTATIAPFFDALERQGLIITKLVMNAAAQGMNCDPLAVSEEEWEDVIHTNVVGGFLCAREATRRMIKYNMTGSILFIGSNTAYHAIKNRSSYIASKGAIASMVKALTLDFGPYGIRVNCLMPGPIHTDRWDALSPEIVAYRRNRAPLRKEAMAIDIANAAYFLSSEMSANTTGSELIIDGGLHVQLHPDM